MKFEDSIKICEDRNYMNIRKLKHTDYANFLFLINQFRNTDFDYATFVYTLSKLQDSEIWVIEKDDKIIASATILFEYKFIFNCCCLAHIEDVIVDENYRKQGFGKMIIKHLIEIAEKNNCYKISLDCSDDNIRFYELCGFSKRGNQMSLLT